MADTGSLEPSPEALAWARRADAWAQQPADQDGQWEQPASRWSEIVPTGTQATYTADGVGWRTETAEWLAAEQTARWRQTTEWRSASGDHGWRSTTEAWQTGGAADGVRPPVDPPTRQQLAISGTAWPTPSDDPQAANPEAGAQAGPWQQFTESTPPWQQPAAEGRPAWQQFAAPAPPWQQGPASASAPPWQPGAAWQQSSEAQSSAPPSPRGPEGSPSWQQLVEPAPGWQQAQVPRPQSAIPQQQPLTPLPPTQPPASPPSWQTPPADPPSWQNPGSATPSRPTSAPATPSWQTPAADPPSWQTPATDPPSWQSPGSTTPPRQASAPATPSWQTPAADPPSWQSPEPATPSRQASAPSTPSWQTPAPDPRPYTGSWSGGLADGSHLVREDDRDRWRREAASGMTGEGSVGRRRAADGGDQRPSDGTGWYGFGDAGGTAAPEAPDRPNGYADRPSWRDVPAISDRPAPASPSGAPGWRDRTDAPTWRDRPEAPDRADWRDGSDPSGQRDRGAAPDWRDRAAAPEQRRDRGAAPDWRDSTAAPDRRRDNEPSTDWRSRTEAPDWRDRAEAPDRRAAPDQGGRAQVPLRRDNDEFADPPGRAQVPLRRDRADAPDWRDRMATADREDRAGDQDRRDRAGDPDRRDRTGDPGWRDRTGDPSRQDRADAPDWRDRAAAPEQRRDRPDPQDWRDRMAAQDRTGDPARRDRTDPPDWRDRTQISDYPDRTDAPTWRRDDDRRDEPSPGWRDRSGSWRGEPDSGSWSRGDDRRDGWRRRDDPDDDDTGEPGWRDAGPDTGDYRRDGRPATDPWAQNVTDTGVIPMSWEQPASDTGSWRRPGDAPISPEVWRPDGAARRDAANWPPDEPQPDWRAQIRQEDGLAPPPPSDAVTEIRQRIDPDTWQSVGREPGDWQREERERAARGSAPYRASDTGDWRRELASESDLADGESRRFGTSEFVPFRPSGSAAVPTSAPVDPRSAPPAPVQGSQAQGFAGYQSQARPAQNGRENLLVPNSDTNGARWQDPPDTQWPPRGAVTGSYERRAVSSLPAASGRSNNLLEPEDDEVEESNGGPLAAVGYTVIWYGVPVVLFVLYMLVLNGSQQSHALSTLASAAPQFGLSLVLSMVVAVGLRWASGSWKAASVGLAAAVMGGGLATVLTSAITGNSLS